MQAECIENIVSEGDIEILQEIMNIAFGQAAADLAEVINIQVVLNVPYVAMLCGSQLAGYMRNEISGCDSVSVVEQNFLGNFRGTAFLVFPSGAGKEVISMLDSETETAGGGFYTDSLDVLEMESLVEIGNILIGACVGKVAELLGDVVTYTPPTVVVENHPLQAMPESLHSAEYAAVVLRTVFSFSERSNVSGFLFLVTGQQTLGWLKQALEKFMEQYA